MIKNIAKDVMAYAICLALVIVTPFLAKPLAACFDWCYLKWTSPGSLRFFFQELFTVLFWLAEITALFLLKGKINPTAQSEKELAIADAQTQEKRILPLKNVGILLLITSVCILIISAQIGFKVKPFYDIGEKVTGYELLDKIAIIAKNAVKCMWILLLLKISDSMANEVLSKANGLSEKAKTWGVYLFTGVLLFIFGVYDVLASANPFALTYLAFYIAFTAIYYLTKKSGAKTILLILFTKIFLINCINHNE
jgi:hypothetical protein